MPVPLIFDAVTLRHFGLVARLDLLEVRCAAFTQPHWAEVVRDELLDSIKVEECQAVLRAGFLGVPASTDGDLVALFEMQASLKGIGDAPRAHLGEAASICIAEKTHGVFVTDDNAAYDFAAKKLGPARVIDTVGLLRHCVAYDGLAPGEAKQVADSITTFGRHLRNEHPSTLTTEYFRSVDVDNWSRSEASPSPE